jgi:hypothetical protein
MVVHLECEIHFDLLELANINFAVSEKDLKDLVNSLKFENILQYVRIPRYKPRSVQSNSSGHSSIHHQIGTSRNDGIARRDFQLIFRLLKERGVQKIIKVIVDDDEDPPHSDDIIEELNPFEIEEWDWRKIDLCSETIFKAAPKAQKVYLYSSGNNAVLRSWSGPDGLNKLAKVHCIAVPEQPTECGVLTPSSSIRSISLSVKYDSSLLCPFRGSDL